MIPDPDYSVLGQSVADEGSKQSVADEGSKQSVADENGVHDGRNRLEEIDRQLKKMHSKIDAFPRPPGVGFVIFLQVILILLVLF